MSCRQSCAGVLMFRHLGADGSVAGANCSGVALASAIALSTYCRCIHCAWGDWALTVGLLNCPVSELTGGALLPGGIG